jgi:hypothetical protein
MRKLVLPTLIAVAAVAAVGGYALVSAGAQRPMNGSIELHGGPTGEACDAESILIELVGNGTMTHLGQVQISAHNCTGATLESGDAEISDGIATYTAADGSTITVEYSGRQEPPAGAIAEYTTTHVVTGGTGRLANAAGTWTVAGTVDLSVGTLLGDVSGWLSY